MKKVLSTVAALGLVAGLASTAAAVEFKMSGKYLVEGAYLSDARGNGVTVDDAANVDTPADAYFLHTFEIKPTMKVNDKVSMTSVIRLADDTFWGGQANGDTEGLSGTNDVYVHQLYMDYASPIGNMKIGRTPAGTYGTSFMDSDKRADRVMLAPSFLADGPWSTLFFVEKGTDQRGTSTTATTYTVDPVTHAVTATTATTTNAATYQSDKDATTYVARVYYKTDTADAGLHYGYTNNKTESSKPWDSTGASTTNDEKHQLTAYGKFKMDNYFANAELTHFMGSIDDYAGVAANDGDYDSWAGMLQVGGKFDALTVSGMYFYAQGQDVNSNDVENALGYSGTGDMFEPLYILTGRHTGMLNNDLFSGRTTTMSNAGAHAFIVAADYAVSNQLSLHGAIGYAKADETNSIGANVDDEYGWEYNVGAAYKLLDNLTYEAHFGYLDTGDFFQNGDPNANTENVYILTHSLTMTF